MVEKKETKVIKDIYIAKHVDYEVKKVSFRGSTIEGVIDMASMYGGKFKIFKFNNLHQGFDLINIQTL